uniref:Uncharacterized protein n=1 Tax=Anguilla anguilla TaxID=7936 RepID=A0A0E9RB69_ANGAN
MNRGKQEWQFLSLLHSPLHILN